MKNNNLGRITIFFNLAIVLSLTAPFFGQETSGEYQCAYLDPSTGSMIISAIVGVFATIVLGVKTFWYKIVRIFNPSKKVPEAKSNKK